MEKRLSPIAALVAAAGALVVSLIFGSETFLRELVLKPSVRTSNVGALLQTLATPGYSEYSLRGGSVVDRWCFLVVFVVAVAVLVLATARRGTGFVAGWTATTAAGSVAGLVRGTLQSQGYALGINGRGSLWAGLLFAGQGANYGLVIGWGVGILVLLGTLLGGRSGAPVGPPTGRPVGGWPPPSAGFGGPDRPDEAPSWTASSPAGAGARPEPPSSPSPGSDRPTDAGPISGDDATAPTDAWDSHFPPTGSSGWERPPADG